jgi:hypothetical protein
VWHLVAAVAVALALVPWARHIPSDAGNAPAGRALISFNKLTHNAAQTYKMQSRKQSSQSFSLFLVQDVSCLNASPKRMPIFAPQSCLEMLPP